MVTDGRIKLKRFYPPLFLFIFWFGTILFWTRGCTAFSTYSYALAGAGSLPRSVTEFRLLSHEGRRVTLADYRGRYLLADFMYLHCSSVCGILRSRLSDYHPVLSAKYSDRLSFLSISFDPERDGVKELNQLWYAMGEPTNWHFLAFDLDYYQSAAKIHSTLEKEGIVVFPAPDDSGDFNHTALFYLIDPEGELVATFDPSQGEKINLKQIDQALEERLK